MNRVAPLGAMGGQELARVHHITACIGGGGQRARLNPRPPLPHAVPIATEEAAE